MADSTLICFLAVVMAAIVVIHSSKVIEDAMSLKSKMSQVNTMSAKDKEIAQHPKIKAFAANAHMRPSKCHVCRVLAEELHVELNKTKNSKQSVWVTNRLDEDDKSKKIEYKNSIMRIEEVMESVCTNTQTYRSIAGPEFPYLKNVKSMFRQQLEEMMGNQNLALKLNAPEELVEDPTMEVRRLHAMCQSMVEDHEDDIMEWYKNHQQINLLDHLCKDIVLQDADSSCLRASTDIPSYAKAPLPADVDPKKKRDFSKPLSKTEL